MVANFEDITRAFERVGFVDVILPFLLIFTIIFAVLEKTRILGEAKRNLNIALSFIFALVVVIPHVTGNLPGGFDPVEIINQALPKVTLIAVAIIAFMVLIGVFAQDKIIFGLTSIGWIGTLSVIAILFIFGSAAGWWSPNFMDWLEEIFGSDTLAWVIMILTIGIILAFLTGGGEKQQLGAFKRFSDNLGELFGGKRQ